MREFKYIGYPLFIILISALLTKLVTMYTVGALQSALITIIKTCALFGFGMNLNKTRKRRYSVWKVVFSVIVTLFLVLLELGLFALPILADIIFFFGASSFFINMMIILCGYMFVD